MLGESLGLPVAEGAVLRSVRREPGRPAPRSVDQAHGEDVGAEPAGHSGQHGLDVGAGPVDLVDEQQRRDAEPLQRAHQDAGLRLHPLDRGEHEHRPVEDGQRALDLGDEVGVAGGVDDVDGQVAERERDDGGTDGDAASALERQGVGLGGPGVDGSGVVDDSREVEEPLGQCGLTGVDMRQDAEVERTCGHA